METGEPGGKPPGRRRLTIRLQTSFGLGTRLWLWLDVSHLNSNLSKKTCKYLSLICQQSGFDSPLAVESCALQCGDLLGPPRTPVFVSCKEKLLVKFASVGDRRHSSPEGEKEAGPWTGAHLPPGVFRGQVFFGNDPSSAASLRSTTRKCDKDGWLWAGGSEDPQVPTTNHARPCGK